MGDPTEHRKLGILIQTKVFPHPWEEMSKTEMTSPHPFGNTCTSTGERQGSDTIWTKYDIGIDFPKMGLRFENVLFMTIMIHAT